MKKLFKASELAEILQVSPQTIYRAAKRGELNSYKIGKSVRFEMPEPKSERTKQWQENQHREIE